MRSIVIAMAVALAAASWTEECQRHCTHDKNHLKSEALVSACETYRYVLPRPKVYRVCKNAFDQAIQHACRKVCTETEIYSSGHTNNGAHHHCKSQRDTVPKPISHEGCVKGYLSGSRAAINFAQDIQNKHKAAMASGDAAADADANAAAEAARAAAAAEAAAAKAKAQAEAAKAKAQAAAEAAQKKKEEEAVKEAAAAKAEAEAAKKAAEEKKQREMEAARAAARAAYSKAQQEEAAAAAAEPAATEPVANLRGGDEVAKE